MALQTQFFTIKSSDGWVLLADGAQNVTLQQQNGASTVIINAGTSTPNNASAYVTLEDAPMAFSGLVAGDQIWAKVPATSPAYVEQAKLVVMSN